jgi:hypothetical protein
MCAVHQTDLMFTKEELNYLPQCDITVWLKCVAKGFEGAFWQATVTPLFS